ncbi:MAG: hypothetical protein ABSC19_00335 [Syntrophorhabdales bacterium]|jgi:hypothetical protein
MANDLEEKTEGNTSSPAHSLTPRQERAILAVLESRTIEEACRKAGITKSLYYRWLRERPVFAAALKSRQEAVSNEALERLQGSVAAAVDVLVRLLDSDRESIRRSVANDVISRFLKTRELGELEERLTNLERLIAQGNHGTGG